MQYVYLIWGKVIYIYFDFFPLLFLEQSDTLTTDEHVGLLGFISCSGS